MTHFSFYDHDATQSECAHHLKFDLHENWSQITLKKKVIAFVLENYRICDKYVQKNTCTHSEKIKVHLPMVKGKRNGLTFTECSVKVCRFLLLSLPF